MNNAPVYTLINSELKQVVGTYKSYAKGASELLKTNNAHFLQGPHRAFYFDDVSAQRGFVATRNLMAFCEDLALDETMTDVARVKMGKLVVAANAEVSKRSGKAT